MLVLTALLLVLGIATRHQWRKVRQDERPEVTRWRMVEQVMLAAKDDGNHCAVCHRVSVVREVVLLYDDAVITCLGCASLLKYQRQEAA